MKIKTKVACLCSVLFLIVGCKAQTEKDPLPSKDSAPKESKILKKETKKEKPTAAPKTFNYTYNSERPLWILIEGSNELLKADGNYQTMVAMESVKDVKTRENLQKKYDEGYAIKLQLEKDEPTGILFLTKAEDKSEELRLEKKELDYHQGKKRADEASEAEKKELEEKMGTPPNKNNTEGSIKNFDEAVLQAKQLMGLTDEEASEYLFYDFGLGNDGREFYQIMVRSKNSPSDVGETQVKVYADNGEAVYGE